MLCFDLQDFTDRIFNFRQSFIYTSVNCLKLDEKKMFPLKMNLNRNSFILCISLIFHRAIVSGRVVTVHLLRKIDRMIQKKKKKIMKRNIEK